MALASHPLKCSSTELAPNVLLMAKIIVLGWVLKGFVGRFPEIFLPFLPFFDTLGSGVIPPPLFKALLQAAFVLGAAGLFLNLEVRKCCLLLGGVILTALLASRPYYHNANFYCACLLILAGLQEKGKNLWLLQGQVSLVYFGAGLNKLLDPDWRSGQFFDFAGRALIERLPWLEVFDGPPFPAMLLAKLLCWTVVIAELGLSVAFLIPRLRGRAMWAGLAFHFPSMIVFRSDFGIFMIAVAASYLVFVPWPEKVQAMYRRESRLSRAWKSFVERIDFDRLFSWTESKQGAALRVTIRGREYAGFPALALSLAFLPAAYFAMTVPASLLRRTVRTVMMFLLLAFFTPLAFSKGKESPLPHDR